MTVCRRYSRSRALRGDWRLKTDGVRRRAVLRARLADPTCPRAAASAVRRPCREVVGVLGTSTGRGVAPCPGRGDGLASSRVTATIVRTEASTTVTVDWANGVRTIRPVRNKRHS